jgi:hypothetical protein
MKYMLPLMLAMWEPGPDPPADVLASQQRSNALNDRILRALRDADAPLLLGTDTGNPFVVPGFSVHGKERASGSSAFSLSGDRTNSA